MATLPLVVVQTPITKKEQATTVTLPAVFTAPIRSDIVRQVVTNMSKNHRQPYAVSKRAGMQHSAESWGTGRAVSRIPRVSGGGTHRAGQGAFGNMCRKGRMFAPTRVWRRWHRKISKGQRRYATVSAIAATASPALVLARGHRIEQLPEVPLVVADADLEKLAKTKEAIKLLQLINAYADVERVINSKQLRAGKGKARNRRYKQRLGPLIVHDKPVNSGLCHAFRAIPGIELANVHRLNLLKLAPGGHLGRFIIWTESAFKALDKVFGTYSRNSAEKKNFRPPIPMLTNPDITRIMTSEEVRSHLLPRHRRQRKAPIRKNPLRNFGAMVKLNPYAATVKRRAILGQKRREKKTERIMQKRKATDKQKKKDIRPRRASEKWIKILRTPAIAPPRDPAEAAPKF